MTTETQGARDKLIEDFKAVMHDAEELLKATENQTGDKIAAVRTRTEESLREARRKLSEMEGDLVEQVNTTAKAAARTTDQLVHDNPWQSVALAAAVGLMLGMLTGRR